MYVFFFTVFTGRRAYSGGGGGGGSSDGSRPSDKRWGAVIQSLRKTGDSLKKNFFRPQFVPKISGGGGGGGLRPLPWIRHWGDVITGSSRWLTDRQQ